MSGAITGSATSGGTAINSRAVVALFGLTISLGAFLLFQVQPLIGKYILPWFGGSAGVWTTCVVFFQVMLVAGYLYAHLAVTYLPRRAQVVVQVMLLAGALAMLPIIPAERWKPLTAVEPRRQILALLLATLGLPCFALSSTAPLVQGWIARVRPGRSPYRLYALSNAASLAALLTFPFLIEPLLSRRTQAYTWSAAYAAFTACFCACALIVHGTAPTHRTEIRATSAARGSLSAPLAHRALWLLLPACASVLFLAVTNKLSMDVAVVPFLWVVPLAIYLLSFIICFDSPRWYRRSIFGPALAVALVAVTVTLWRGQLWGLGVNLIIYYSVLFVCCMVCHGELVALRPEPQRLTGFYLSIAIGGAAGGAFVGLAAPLVFDRFLELHLGLALTWGLLLAAVAVDRGSRLYALRPMGRWLMLIGFGALLVAGLWADVELRSMREPVVTRVRNFYGILSVHESSFEGKPVLSLQHNGVIHGMQFRGAERRREPTAYFAPRSGIGRLMADRHARLRRPLRVGVVGLGAGTLAAAGGRGDVMRFYEIDEDVERLARSHFTFLADSPASIDVVIGDARLSMEREPAQGYDVLALDAFSGGGVPVHLLTREAMATYLRHLSSGGVLALHVTNRHIDLTPVVEALAADYRLEILFVRDEHADWALLAGDPTSLDGLRIYANPGEPRRMVRLWTDDYASLLPILK